MKKNVLNKGLKFTPVPPSCDSNELKGDIYEFSRKLRLAEYFEGMEDEDIFLRRNRSDFVPHRKRNTNLEKYIQTVEDFPLEPQKKTKVNLSKMETEAIKTLANDTSIVIKEADKGGVTIIMDQSHYKDMVENTLNDKNFYETPDSDPSKAEKLKYTKFLTKHKNCLTKKELEYLEKFEVKSSNFYGLPKVHKSSHINNKCKNANSSYVEISDVNDLKLRLIVAGPSCQTHRLSDSIDILLNPYTKHVNSYLRDTIDF